MTILAVALFGGCNDRHTAAPRPQPTFGTGSVHGTVTFFGTAPTPATIPNQPCHAGAPELKDESVVVSATGQLANVIVYLQGASASDGSAEPPVLLDQKDCRYIPHAIAVQTGQTLTIRSSDAAVHNVHYAPDHNPAANLSLVNAGDSRNITFDQPEIFRARCDIHPWMNATVAVFDHPFFAVTDAAGSFAIDRIPAGRYTIVAQHELYGQLTQPITVADNTSSAAVFVYKPPTSASAH
jgi:plastocyanin